MDAFFVFLMVGNGRFYWWCFCIMLASFIIFLPNAGQKVAQSMIFQLRFFDQKGLVSDLKYTKNKWKHQKKWKSICPVRKKNLKISIYPYLRIIICCLCVTFHKSVWKQKGTIYRQSIVFNTHKTARIEICRTQVIVRLLKTLKAVFLQRTTVLS